MRRIAAPALAALSLALCACGSGGAGKRDVLVTGTGVTGPTIALGILTDRSGPFASYGRGTTQGEQAYWKAQNATGGVCGRKVSLLVADSGYEPRRAATLYRRLRTRVLALQQLEGAPVATTLLGPLERDSMYASMAGGPPSLLRSRVVASVGATSDLEAIGGIDWMVRHRGLKRGERIGVLHVVGGYGDGALAGVRYAARREGLEVVEREVGPTDTNVAAPVAAFGRARVRALWVASTPGQLASLAREAQTSGLHVPVGTDGEAFSPRLPGDVTTFTSTAPISGAQPAIRTAAAAYRKDFPGQTPGSSVVAGWAQAEIMDQVLQKACDDDALTPGGVVRALHELNLVDTGGVVAGPLDFSQPGQPSTQAIYVLTADRTAPGGQQLFEGPYVSPAARGYVYRAP